MSNLRATIEREIAKEIKQGSYLKAQDQAMRLNDIMGWIDVYASNVANTNTKTEQYVCKSYFDETNVLKECTCGECK